MTFGKVGNEARLSVIYLLLCCYASYTWADFCLVDPSNLQTSSNNGDVLGYLIDVILCSEIKQCF